MNKVFSGFTLVELIIVITLLGLISSIALPKFFDLTVYKERLFFDDTLNSLRFAQKLAIATGCSVQVSINSNQYQIKRQGNSASTTCPGGSVYNLSVSHPARSGNELSGSEAGISLTSTPAVFKFLSLGTASSDVTLLINGRRRIQVLAATGLVYDDTP